MPRKGVPQGWQSHGLHARGREILEEFFPGLTDELVAHGASLGDVQADVRWINDGHRLRPAVSGMRGIAFSRPLLEHLVRSRVRALPGVTICAPLDVLDLTAAGDRVTGVQVRVRGTVGDGEMMAADLVVDATGRGSARPGVARQPRFPAARRSRRSRSALGYTTWEFPRAAGDLGGDIAAIVAATVDNLRFGAALACEGAALAGHRGRLPRPARLGHRHRRSSAGSPPRCPHRTSATWSRSASRSRPAGCTGSGAAGGGTTRSCAASPVASWSSATR